ncbi:hypothetical protein [Peromfec virus RodF5_7]|uniref:Uncharacterized protein n=1 Tax=Peromfec virus RodF5_7 TaxID=2929343 RepID=A0A976R5J8_9VIRU|nr:hypothetical protein [Peromfec virus RodF5_7]
MRVKVFVSSVLFEKALHDEKNDGVVLVCRGDTALRVACYFSAEQKDEFGCSLELRRRAINKALTRVGVRVFYEDTVFEDYTVESDTEFSRIICTPDIFFYCVSNCWS